MYKKEFAKKQAVIKRLADCGVSFEHNSHPYRTRAGIKICDGSITKRVSLPQKV
jgi:hypothetical protein